MIYTPKEDLRFASSSRPNDFPGRPLLEDREISEQSGIPLKYIDGFTTYIEKQVADGVKIHLDNGRPGNFTFASKDYIHSTAHRILRF